MTSAAAYGHAHDTRTALQSMCVKASDPQYVGGCATRLCAIPGSSAGVDCGSALEWLAHGKTHGVVSAVHIRCISGALGFCLSA